MLGRYPGQIDLCVTLTYYLEERFFFKARRSGISGPDLLGNNLRFINRHLKIYHAAVNYLKSQISL